MTIRTIKSIVILTMMIVPFLGAGWGTVRYCSGDRGLMPHAASEPERPIYGGVRVIFSDWEATSQSMTGNPFAVFFVGVSLLDIIDIPLSFAGDTILLPYTIPKAYRSKKQKNVNREEGSAQPTSAGDVANRAAPEK